jgi:hypothetical protein
MLGIIDQIQALLSVEKQDELLAPFCWIVKQNCFGIDGLLMSFLILSKYEIYFKVQLVFALLRGG